MISLAFISAQDVLSILGVVLFLLIPYFIKHGASGVARNLGRFVGSLTNPAPRPQNEPRQPLPAPASLEEQYKKALGLTGPFTAEDLKARWLALSRQYHPDFVNHLGPKLKTVAEQEMKTINEAYQYLCKKYGL